MTRLYPLPLSTDDAGPLVCRCMQVYERELLDAMAVFDIQTLADIKRFTGAGDGCTCCHAKLRCYLELQVQSASASPICSVK